MAVDNHKGVVIVYFVVKPTVASLAVPLQKLCYYIERRSRCVSTFESQAYEVHAGKYVRIKCTDQTKTHPINDGTLFAANLENKASLPITTPCSFTPISAPLVEKSIGDDIHEIEIDSPDPHWLAKQYCVGIFHLRNRNIGAIHIRGLRTNC